MKRYFVRDDGAVSHLHETGAHIPGYRAVYLAFEADALIAELKQALREIDDLFKNRMRNHMDIDPEVGRIVSAALGKQS